MGSDCLIYLSLILITFDTFPFNRYGMGSAKAISIIPIIFFIVLNIPNILRLRYKKIEIMEIILMIFLLLVSFFMGKFIYNDMIEFKATISMFSVYLTTVFSIRIFFKNANKEKILKLFKSIYYSFNISLFFGILEFVYFYIFKSEIIYKFLMLFLRDDMYLKGRRLQFNFGEPSTASIIIPCLFIPTILIMRKLGYRFTKIDKFKIVTFLVLSIFTQSTTYYLIMSLLIILYLLFYNNNLNIKKFIIATIAIAIAISGYVFINSTTFKNYSQTSDNRAIKLIGNLESIQSDESFQVRGAMWKISIMGWKQKPITGYGWGYFKYAYVDNFNDLSSLEKNNRENQSKLYMDNLQSYSIYSTSMVEGGILGIIWIIIMMVPAYINTKKNIIKPFLITFLVSALQGMVIYNVISIIFLEICKNKNIIYAIEGEHHNEKVSYMSS